MVNDFLENASYRMPGLKKVMFHAPVQTKNLCYLISTEKKNKWSI